MSRTKSLRYLATRLQTAQRHVRAVGDQARSLGLHLAADALERMAVELGTLRLGADLVADEGRDPRGAHRRG